MICKTLFALCILTAGLRVQSLLASTLLPVSLSSKITTPTSIWTSSSQNTTATASPTGSNSLLPVTPSSQTSPLPKNVSIETKEKEITRPASNWEGTTAHPAPSGFSSSSGGVQLTSTPAEHSSGTPEASVPPRGTQSPAESPTVISSQAPTSSPTPPSTLPPEAPAASATTVYTSAVTSTKPSEVPTPAGTSTEEHSFDSTPALHAITEPVTKETTPQATVTNKITCEPVGVDTTTSVGVIVEQVEHALSSGSIAAITVTVIAVVLLVFGIAAYLKIRHSSYGRLLDDHDYGSWGNYNNPLYDDS